MRTGNGEWKQGKGIGKQGIGMGTGEWNNEKGTGNRNGE